MVEGAIIIFHILLDINKFLEIDIIFDNSSKYFSKKL